VIQLNEKGERGRKFYLSMERAFPGFTDTYAVSVLVHQLEATSLPAKTKRRMMREIERMRVERIKEHFHS